MKKIFIFILLLPFALKAQVFDTTYLLTAIPATDAHNVLVENFVGASNVNTPAGSVLLNALKNASPYGRINIIDLYIFGPPQTLPPTGSHHDFRDSTATLIGNAIYGGISALPSAGIDRISGEEFFSSTWSSEIVARMAIADSLNLIVNCDYNVGVGLATITATITYTRAVSTLQNISIAIVEDSVVDLQEGNRSSIFIDSFYLFNDVFRGLITAAPFGDPILPTLVTKEAGRVYQCQYSFAPDTSWVPNHCRVIAFVNGNSVSSTTVYQSAQTGLTTNTTSGIVATTPATVRIFPNPAKDIFYVKADNDLNYYLLSITGSIVATGFVRPGTSGVSVQSLSPGLYFLELHNRDGQKSISKIVKD